MVGLPSDKMDRSYFVYFLWLATSKIPTSIKLRSEHAPGSLNQRNTHRVLRLLDRRMYGAAFDYQTQQDVYVIDPNKGRIPKGFFVFVPVFVVIAVSLLWASIQNERYLAVALTLFCILDVIGWHHNQTWMKPIFEASFRFYETEHDYFGYERLSFAKSYFFGRWALWRYATMLAILGSILLISFNGLVRDNLSQAIHYTTGLDSAKISEITPGVLILFFVLTAESWIWVNRIRIRVSMNAIASVKDKIVLHFREIPKQ